MKSPRSLPLFACLALTHGLLAAPPTDNPVATFHAGNPDGYPAWTDRMAWHRVIDMSTYENGANDFERFENARDEIHAQGGGVLYYPGGDYDFTDMPADGPDGRGLMLRSGVVLRGATPTGDRWARGDGGGEDGTLELPTRFLFGFTPRVGTGVTPTGETPRDWNFVGLLPSEDESLGEIEDVGVAWIHFVGASVFWGFEMNWSGATYANAGGWKSALVKADWANRVADGTFPWDYFAGARLNPAAQALAAGAGRLVFGCVFEDSAPVNNVIMEGRGGGKNFGPDGYWLQKFGARVQVYGSEVYVGNNVFPKSRRSFLYRQTVGHNPQQSENAANWINREETILFDYNYSTAVDINKEYLNPFANKDAIYFLPGVVVRDNFVYNHGRKGFNLSGEWMTIRNNHNARRILSQTVPPDYGPASGQAHYLTLDGYVQCKPGGSGSISDSLSRAFDLAGGPLWIDSNTYDAARSNVANDGEGILCQAHGGTQLFSWAVTRNAGPEYMAGYDVHHYGSLWAWNNAGGKRIGNIKAGNLFDMAVVGNTSGNTATDGNALDPDGVLTTCPGSSPLPPQNVVASLEESSIRITFDDVASNEIGFRVDRLIDGGDWHAVAYRPRQSYAHPQNPTEWVDYLAPRGIELHYRVVAINCADDDTGASSPTGPLILPLIHGVPPLPSDYEEWAADLPPGASAPGAVPFGDGIANFLRFALGGEASAGSLAAHLPRVEEHVNGLTLHFVRRTGFGDIAVETSSDLNTWEPLPEVPEISYHTEARNSISEEVVVTLEGWQAADGRFFRLAVTLP